MNDTPPPLPIDCPPPVWLREPVISHPYFQELPEATHSWFASQDPANTRYFSASLDDSPLVNAAALAILRLWPRPIHIDFMLHLGAVGPMWQVLGGDSPIVVDVLAEWLAFARGKSAADPEMFLRMRMSRTIGLPQRDSKHEQLHRLALRDGGWACAYCGVGLIDVCSDEDMVYDHSGRRLVSPGSIKRLPTKDHLVPQSLGGSHALANLVLACRSCNSRKGAT